MDPSTASNYDDIQISHVDLSLDVRFDTKRILSSERLDIKLLKSCKEIILDTHNTLTIHSVIATKPIHCELKFKIKPFTSYGEMVQIELPSTFEPGDEFQLSIDFTSSDGTGVTWLDPVQTAGKELPYMFTSGWPVRNRAFFPIQDTPSAKMTYSARVKVPPGFTALMGANEWIENHTPNVFEFKMAFPIAPYLINLVVGDIVSAEIGPRSKVWTEPNMLSKAKAEYDGEIETILCTAEHLFGPYIWGKYDLLVLPPSYPFGGMEIPCLTFLTPCLLSGDKSLMSTVYHEITHSWFGNMVTPATWKECWISEGFARYGERRIMMVLNGEAESCLESVSGLSNLQRHYNANGEDLNINCLKINSTKDFDPNDVYCPIPYEKGYCLVRYLEHLAGGYEHFEKFLRAYIDKFKFKSVNGQDILDYFLDYFPHYRRQEIENRKDYEFDKWLNNPGWPPYVPDLSAGNDLTKPAEILAAMWAGEETQGSTKFSNDITNWPIYQVIFFLDKLLAKLKLPDGTIQQINEKYPTISQSQNAEGNNFIQLPCIKL
ncbi:aminopeptidase B-like [Saccoglossus kowalevskii]